jgi:hypothetical protein
MGSIVRRQGFFGRHESVSLRKDGQKNSCVGQAARETAASEWYFLHCASTHRLIY